MGRDYSTCTVHPVNMLVSSSELSVGVFLISHMYILIGSGRQTSRLHKPACCANLSRLRPLDTSFGGKKKKKNSNTAMCFSLLFY